MTVDELRNALKNVDGSLEVFFRRVPPIAGNIESAGRVDVSTYGFFGESIPCVVIEPTSEEEDGTKDRSRP